MRSLVLLSIWMVTIVAMIEGVSYPVIYMSLSMAMIGSIRLYLTYQRENITQSMPLFFLGFCLLAVLIFFHQGDEDFTLPEEVVMNSLSGVVTNSPVLTSGGDYLRFEWQTGEVGRVLVYMLEEENGIIIESGARCMITNPDFIRPENPSNPHEFDFATYLNRQNIHSQLFIRENQIRCHPDTEGGFHTIRRFRESGIQHLDEAVGHSFPRASALIRALVYGDRAEISKDVMNAYQRLGIVHLLAVSGLHVGLLTLYLHWILMRIGITREFALWILLLILPFFMIVAGGAPSVVRASVTVMTVILVKKAGGNLKAVDAIAVVCMMLLAMNPALIHHIGFQLSFLTSFALILSSELLKDSSRLRQLVLVTISAQVISAPVTISIFHEWSILAVLANLLMVPLVTLILLPCAYLAVIVLSLHESLVNIPVAMIEGILLLVEYVLIQAGKLPFAAILFGALAEWQLLVLCAAVLSFFLIWELGGERSILKAGIPFVLSLSMIYVTPYLDSRSTVTFLDVGQGDAAVIELPYRKGVYMVDTGGAPSWRETDGPYEYVIKPFLRGQGIRKLDKVLLSHGHHDHVGELCALADDIKVKQVLFSGLTEPEDILLEGLKCMSGQGSHVSYSTQRDRWIDGNTAWQVLHPGADDIFAENDMSMVLTGSIYGVTLLFTGDIEAEVEQRLVKNNLLQKVDILKAAHHGSRTSSSASFLEATGPVNAVISVGRNNTYGHPHDEVLERFLTNDTLLYQTGNHGAVQFRIFRDGYEVKTFRSE